MSVKENAMKDIKGDFMNPFDENKAKDSTVVDITVAPSPYKDHEALVINCSKIVFVKGGMSITLDGGMDYTAFEKIIINGVVYERVKKRDDRDDPSLQYFGL